MKQYFREAYLGSKVKKTRDKEDKNEETCQSRAVSDFSSTFMTKPAVHMIQSHLQMEKLT